MDSVLLLETRISNIKLLNSEWTVRQSWLYKNVTMIVQQTVDWKDKLRYGNYFEPLKHMLTACRITEKEVQEKPITTFFDDFRSKLCENNT